MRLTIRSVVWLGLLAAFPPVVGGQEHDLVLRNGRVIDPESGLDAIRNVGIRGGRIAYVGSATVRGRQEIDATGLVVAPGFIDLHRHAHGDNSYRFQVLDGVTTSLELEVGTADVDAWYAARDPGRLLNYGVAVGHITVRMRVTGDTGVFLPVGPAARKDLTDPERAELIRLLDLGLRRGGLAMGIGLTYTPAATSMEALQVFRVAGTYGASVHTHLRGGMSSLIETIGAATIAGTPLHVVHLNSTGGPRVEYFFAAIDEARRHGLDVTTEMYPYTAGSTRIESAMYDTWESWPEERFATLQWAATGERLTRETFRRYRAQGGSVISHSNTEASVLTTLRHPGVMIASDGGRDERDRPTHPRATGTYAKVLGRYVREQRVLELADALARMTLLPARRLEARVPEMKDRGRVRVGAFADLTVFDAATVIDRSTYERPAEASTGVRHVFVNGVAVVREGRIVDGATPGRAVRAPITP